jgi:hypothetical protein
VTGYHIDTIVLEYVPWDDVIARSTRPAIDRSIDRPCDASARLARPSTTARPRATQDRAPARVPSASPTMFAATTTTTTTTTRCATTTEAHPRQPRGLRVAASGVNDAAKTTGGTIARRQALKHALNAAFVASVLTAGDRAWAILPGNDDEDEAFLQKAKENRANRIQSEVSKEKAYVNDTGLKQDENTAKIQLAVYKLSKSGGMIESGALADAAGELSGSWVSDTQAGADALGAASEAKSFASAVSALQGKCANGDDAGAKSAYGGAAKALRALASAAGVESKLRLL